MSINAKPLQLKKKKEEEEEWVQLLFHFYSKSLQHTVFQKLPKTHTPPFCSHQFQKQCLAVADSRHPPETDLRFIASPATRTTALSAGSSTESWLFLFLLSCLDRFHGNVSPGGPTSPDGQGDSEPPERSVRKDGSLTQERSLRVSSSDDSISPHSCREGQGMEGRRRGRKLGVERKEVRKERSGGIVRGKRRKWRHFIIHGRRTERSWMMQSLSTRAIMQQRGTGLN